MKRVERKMTVVAFLAGLAVKNKPPVTMTYIAHCLQLEPSTYLMELLKEMWVSNQIELEIIRNPRNKDRNIYRWSVELELSLEQKELPWNEPVEESTDQDKYSSDILATHLNQKKGLR